jgi:hypothetical protein
MYDYVKLWVEDLEQIETILNNKKFDFYSLMKEETGHITKRITKYKNWELKTLSPRLLEITGSIHIYWNNGTNENDFTFSDSSTAINSLCDDLCLDPRLALIKNLEFGVNLNPVYNASEILDQLICFQNQQPLHCNKGNDIFFIEYETDNYYFKIYDKGKQYQSKKVCNTLRIEVKARNNRFLNFARIQTLHDLLNVETMHLLGMKIAKVFEGLLFDDDTLNIKNLSVKEREFYKELKNPKTWNQYKGKTNSTVRLHRKKI